MNDRLHWWLVTRPILGVFVKGGPIVLRPPNYYVIRHARFNLWWRDPYKLRENQNGHLAEWGTLRQAWRFSTGEIATGVLSEMGEVGYLETYEFDA